MNELEDLVVSGAEMDQSLVKGILEPYLRLDKETCSIRPTEKWNDKLGNEEKIILYLVARKAMRALDFPLEVEEAAASEVVKQTGIPEGSAYPRLRSLLKERLVDQIGKRGGYIVPNHALPRIKSRLSQKEGEQ